MYRVQRSCPLKAGLDLKNVHSTEASFLGDDDGIAEVYSAVR